MIFNYIILWKIIDCLEVKLNLIKSKLEDEETESTRKEMNKIKYEDFMNDNYDKNVIFSSLVKYMTCPIGYQT